MPINPFAYPKPLAFIAGAILPCAFAPYGQSYLAPFMLAILFFCWQQCSTPQQAAWLGYLFGLGQFGLGTWWVFISMHEFSGAGTLPSSLLTLLFISVLALFPALAGGTARWLCRGEMPVWQVILIFPTTWIIGEIMRGSIMNGFPWLEIGYSQTDTPLAGYAPVFGSYGVGWLTALTAASIWLLFQIRVAAYRLVASLILIWAAGAGLKLIDWHQPAGEPFQATLLQGNIPQDLKWQPETRRRILETYLTMTRQHWDSGLIVWPETAVPAFLHQVRDSFINPLEKEAIQKGTDLLIGVPVLDQTTNQYYNAIISLGQTPGVYYKRHLVPFGEYLPLRSVFGFVLDLLQIPLSDFAAGSDDQPLLIAAGFTLSPTICYEDAFARDALAGLPEAAYMVNVSNDAWFGDSIAPHQHLQMARMRALEGARFLLRATNTGITSVIGPDGKVRSQAAQFVRTSLTEQITPLAGATPYVRWRDWPLWLWLFIISAGGLWLRLRGQGASDENG